MTYLLVKLTFNIIIYIVICVVYCLFDRLGSILSFKESLITNEIFTNFMTFTGYVATSTFLGQPDICQFTSLNTPIIPD